ncbi:MAG: hypothetical protein LBJ32_00585 [Oscillospiraceae bacterium]|jgi:hypothetical protein|nr:hypothetical protein [Oscillospiraceae bacterium]
MMTNIKLFLGNAKSLNKSFGPTINRAKNILKIQNLFKVNKFFQKAFAAILAVLFIFSIINSVILIQANAMNMHQEVQKDKAQKAQEEWEWKKTQRKKLLSRKQCSDTGLQTKKNAETKLRFEQVSLCLKKYKMSWEDLKSLEILNFKVDFRTEIEQRIKKLEDDIARLKEKFNYLFYSYKNIGHDESGRSISVDEIEKIRKDEYEVFLNEFMKELREIEKVIEKESKKFGLDCENVLISIEEIVNHEKEAGEKEFEETKKKLENIEYYFLSEIKKIKEKEKLRKEKSKIDDDKDQYDKICHSSNRFLTELKSLKGHLSRSLASFGSDYFFSVEQIQKSYASICEEFQKKFEEFKKSREAEIEFEEKIRELEICFEKIRKYLVKFKFNYENLAIKLLEIEIQFEKDTKNLVNEFYTIVIGRILYRGFFIEWPEIKSEINIEFETIVKNLKNEFNRLGYVFELKLEIERP